MSIQTTVVCDGFHCSNELEIDDSDSVENAINHYGWVEDPNCGWQHYCKKCVEQIEKEGGFES